MVGPSWRARARCVAATSSATEVRGFCTDVTCIPAACRRSMTSDQDEPSAYAPCTSTTLCTPPATRWAGPVDAGEAGAEEDADNTVGASTAATAIFESVRRLTIR